MAAIQHVPSDALIVGYDFSTGGVKALAFDTAGNAVTPVGPTRCSPRCSCTGATPKTG